MFESKYSKVLTVILVIVIIAILGLLGFLGYDFYKKTTDTHEASDFVDSYQGDSVNNDDSSSNNNSSPSGNEVELNATPTGNSSTSGKRQQYRGHDVAGTISIPKINIDYPILEEITADALSDSVVLLYPTNAEAINQPGNVVIAGHNYRNGAFFSNLKRVSNGDKVYITDYLGNRKTYTIYDKFEADQSDTSFYQRDTGGKAEITLSTCTDASNNIRTIVFAREDG